MKPTKMTDALYAVVTAAFDADDVSAVCAALLSKRADLRDVDDIPRSHGMVDKVALCGVGLTLRMASRLAAKLDPQGVAAQPAPAAPTAITVRLHDDDPRKMAPRAFLEHLVAHHAEDPSLVAWADAQHPLLSTRGVVATGTGIDVEATCGPEGLWSQKRDWRGATWLDQRVTTAADALMAPTVEERDPIHPRVALQRGMNPRTRVSWARVSRHDRGFAVWLATYYVPTVQRDDGARFAQVASAGGLADDDAFGPLLKLYAQEAQRDPDWTRSFEADAYVVAKPSAPGWPTQPTVAGATIDRRALGGALAPDRISWERLAGAQINDLVNAIMSAFPGVPELDRMVLYGLGENRVAIAGGNDLRAMVFSLVTWAQAGGHTQRLFDAARKGNPTNPKLLALAERA